jgi:polyisoprenoid-binding protein YceI
MNVATSTPRSRTPLVLLLAAVVVVAVIGVGIYLFLRDDAPAAVDLEATRDALEEGDGQAADGAAEPASGTIEGTWTVDTSVGEFSVEDETTATFVGFRVAEELTSIGSTTAIGRTPEVSGTVEISGQTLTAAEIVADLTQIESNERRRESPIQRALNTSTNPTATFVLSAPIELGAGAAAGELVETAATGQLTVNGTTNDVEIALQAQLVDGKILVTGTTEVVFADYGVTAPSAPIVVSVEDHGIVELQLWFSA